MSSHPDFININRIPDIDGVIDWGRAKVLWKSRNTWIYKAEWSDRYGRVHDVAIKIMPPTSDVIDDIPLIVKRMSRQYAVWSKLDHPNVARLYGKASYPLYRHDFRDIPCLISEFYPGGSLAQYVENEALSGRAKNHDAMHRRFNMVKDIARGLQYLHSKGIVHGDFCPENIMLNQWKDKPIIGDFGFSRIMSQHGFTSVTCPDNYRYLPPAGEDLDYRSREVGDYSHASGSRAGDVWSFGMLALKVMSCCTPYHELQSTTKRDVEAAKCAGVRPYPLRYRLVNGRRWYAFWTLLQKCWRRNRDQRPDMDQVLRELIEVGSQLYYH